MKLYEKKYEDYPIIEYKWKGRTRSKCDLTKISTRRNEDIDQYILKIRDEMWTMEKDFFSRAVKLIWLVDQFGYNNDFRSRIGEKKGSPGIRFLSALGSFIQYYVGFDHKLFLQTLPAQIIRSYINDWYPNIRQENPFEIEIKYPYEYMNLGCVALVNRMPERMELLKNGEEGKMTFSHFVNYVVNYIFCYNEEHGETYYLYRPPRYKNSFLFVRLTKPYEQT